MMLTLWLLLCFLAGTVTGVLWREAIELLCGRDDPVDLWERVKKVRVPVFTTGLIVSMVFTGLVGIRLQMSDNARGELVRCLSEYNQRESDARASRVTAQELAAAAELDFVREEIDYQAGLLDALQDDTPTARLQGVVETRLVTARRYEERLMNLREVREEKPYPQPDLCEDR